MRGARIFKLEDRGFLRVARDVKQPQDLVQEIEPEEQAGDLLIGEALFKEDEEDLPNEQLRNTSAAYLLWIKETYNLSQKALDDTVQLTGTRQHKGQEDCSVSSLILFFHVFNNEYGETQHAESSGNEIQSSREPWQKEERERTRKKRQRKDEVENETAARVKGRRSGSDMVAYLREKNDLM